MLYFLKKFYLHLSVQTIIFQKGEFLLLQIFPYLKYIQPTCIFYLIKLQVLNLFQNCIITIKRIQLVFYYFFLHVTTSRLRTGMQFDFISLYRLKLKPTALGESIFPKDQLIVFLLSPPFITEVTLCMSFAFTAEKIQNKVIKSKLSKQSTLDSWVIRKHWF